ncbi:MAG: hypothetical protein M0Q91_17315 [Methanoregula sp.]|nr:hypothetical protein [Methanoregula sp.]
MTERCRQCEKPMAPEQRDKPGASSYPQETPENKGGDVKRTGASAMTSERDRAFAYQPGPMVPALGLVGGTPGWAVREIVSRSKSGRRDSSLEKCIFIRIPDKLPSSELLLRQQHKGENLYYYSSFFETRGNV